MATDVYMCAIPFQISRSSSKECIIKISVTSPATKSCYLKVRLSRASCYRKQKPAFLDLFFTVCLIYTHSHYLDHISRYLEQRLRSLCSNLHPFISGEQARLKKNWNQNSFGRLQFLRPSTGRYPNCSLARVDFSQVGLLYFPENAGFPLIESLYLVVLAPKPIFLLKLRSI